MKHVSRRLFDGLRAIAARHSDVVNDVRGAGLIAGLDMKADAMPIVKAALDRGLLINRTSETVIRLLPPYIITEHDVDEALTIIDAAIAATR